MFSLLLRFKISGHSMIPTYKEGEELLVSSIPYLFLQPKVGDVIVFKDQKHYVVKRIQEIKGEKFLVKGDNKEDSKEYGWIEKKKIIGKVILKLS